MKYNRRQILKLFTVALAMALVVSSFMFGSAPVATSASYSAAAAEEEARGEASPRAESIEATPLEKETERATPPARAIRPDPKVAPTVNTVIASGRVLRDDGLDVTSGGHGT